MVMNSFCPTVRRPRFVDRCRSDKPAPGERSLFSGRNLVKDAKVTSALTFSQQIQLSAVGACLALVGVAMTLFFTSRREKAAQHHALLGRLIEKRYDLYVR